MGPDLQGRSCISNMPPSPSALPDNLPRVPIIGSRRKLQVSLPAAWGVSHEPAGLPAAACQGLLQGSARSAAHARTHAGRRFLASSREQELRCRGLRASSPHLRFFTPLATAVAGAASCGTASEPCQCPHVHLPKVMELTCPLPAVSRRLARWPSCARQPPLLSGTPLGGSFTKGRVSCFQCAVSSSLACSLSGPALEPS